MERMPTEMFQHYELGMEVDRLSQHAEILESERTEEILRRFLPPPPAAILATRLSRIGHRRIKALLVGRGNRRWAASARRGGIFLSRAGDCRPRPR